MEQKLETFLTLCQTLHYGRAAERLHLSQPAVSKQLALRCFGELPAVIAEQSDAVIRLK